MERIFTEQETKAIYEAEKSLRESGLDVDHEHAGHNADLIWQYFQANPSVPVTVAAIKTLVENRRSDFAWFKTLTPLESEYQKLAARMTQDQKQTILSYITERDFKDSGDALLQNFNILATWILDKNFPITSASLDAQLANIVSGTRGRVLLRKQRLQGSALEAQKTREAQREAAAQPKQEDETEVPSYVPAHLVPHYRQIHAAMAQAKERKPEGPSQQNQEVWKARADSITADSNSDQIQIKRIFIMQENDKTQIDWQATHRSRLTFVERRRNQRAYTQR